MMYSAAISHSSSVALMPRFRSTGLRHFPTRFSNEKFCMFRVPVLLKRGMSATLEEWLMAAEYIMAGGNYQVILCERGVRTFADHSRNTLDLSVIPPAKALSHLPVFVDPSHGTGKRAYVPAMALAGLAAGADGLLIETHPDPERALSDGAQSLDFPGMEKLLGQLKTMAAVLGRTM